MSRRRLGARHGGHIRAVPRALCIAAQCRPQLLSAGIKSTSTSQVNSTALVVDESRDCALVFCTKTRCDSRSLGWIDCYCCESQKPDAPCYKTRDACTAECPVCDDTKRTPQPSRYPSSMG